MTARRPMQFDVIEARYPRLIVAMCWAAILNRSEAANAIYMMQIDDPRGGGEAVMHFGGARAVILAAIRCRHIARRSRAAWAQAQGAGSQ